MQVIFKKKVSITLVLLITCIFTLNFAGIASAGDLNSTRQLFDRFEALQGPWNYGYPNDAGGIGWGEACVIRAYLGMYAATGDKVYLDKFVYHADKLLQMRDSDRGVTDYRGLSLPAWRAGDTYTKGKGWYIYGVHTGMTAYPLAEFARVVNSDNSLSAYKAKADTYLQAAKDAVAIHKSDFVNDGDAGYYRETPGSPAEFDGAPVPINQYLAMARAELVLYQVTGDNLYLDHVTRMARHFKSQLKVDPATGAYTWHYWFGLGETGWSAASKVSVNTPAYGGYIQFEDWSHGVIDVDFAALAYKAGIVFTEDDMKKFGLTAKNMLKSDGSVAVIVNGVGTAANPELIGQWLRLYQYAPSLAPAVDRIDSSLQAAMPGGFNGIAMLAQVYSGKMDYPVSSTPPPSPPPVQPPQGEIVVNGDFSNGATGWNDVGGSIVTESGNQKFRRQTSEQNFYQMAQVPAGDYTLNVATRKGTATSARIIVGFYDSAGKYTIGNDVTYQFKGTGWESVTAIPVKVPAGTAKVRITPFAVSDTNGTVDFDNVSFIAGAQPTNPPPADPAQPPQGEIMINGAFSQGSTGWNDVGGSIVTESGNQFRRQTSEQNFYQMVQVPGGDYSLNVAARKGTATSARIIVGFYDSAGKYAIGNDVTYQFRGTGWESVTAIPVKVPAGTAKVRITPFAVSDTNGTVDFDNISFKAGTQPTNPPPGNVDTTAPTAQVTAPAANSIVKGNLSLTAQAGDNVKVTEVTFEFSPPGGGQWVAAGLATETNGAWSVQWDTTKVADGAYSVRAVARDAAGNKGTSGAVAVTIDNTKPLVGPSSLGSYSLQKGGTMAVNYTLSEDAVVSAAIYDSAGILTRTLVNGASKTKGSQQLAWDGKNSAGTPVNPGTYTIKITAVDQAGNSSDPVTGSVQVLSDAELIVNGNFSQGATGWNDVGGSIVTESNGNQFRRQTSEQNFYQMVQVPAGDYTLNLAIRKGTATSARIIVGFYDSAGKYTIGNDVTYQFKGTGWESLQAISVKVPAGTAKVRITPFAVSDTNFTVDFDNVSFKAGAQPTNPPPADPVQEIIVNGDFSKGTTGWSNIGGSFKTDGTGNMYRSQTFDQNFYQMINSIAAGQYVLNLQTMRGIAAVPARIIVGYYTASGSYKILSDVTYKYKGSNWESVPEIVFNVPTDAYRLRITLFSGSSSVPVNFDNVSLKKK